MGDEIETQQLSNRFTEPSEVVLYQWLPSGTAVQVSDVTSGLGVSKSSARRRLNYLSALGYVVKSKTTGEGSQKVEYLKTGERVLPEIQEIEQELDASTQPDSTETSSGCTHTYVQILDPEEREFLSDPEYDLPDRSPQVLVQLAAESIRDATFECDFGCVPSQRDKRVLREFFGIELGEFDTVQISDVYFLLTDLSDKLRNEFSEDELTVATVHEIATDFAAQSERI